jgi:hypothetical protein
MAEPYGITLRNAGNFDGATPIALGRGNLTVDGQRLYTGSVPPGGGGLIDSDFFGLFAPQSPKLVGVAFSSFNPQSVVRVIDAAGQMRQELNLTGDFQYVLLHGRDRLAVLTRERPPHGTTLDLFLVVNELSEGDHMAWALAHPPAPVHTRLRIIRNQGGFTENLAGVWVPDFVWDPVANILSVTDDATNAPIPISALSPFPRQFGTLLTIRYANSSNDGKVIVVENQTRKKWEAQTALPDVKWSRVQYVAHDDLIVLAASPSPVGGRMVCDIELVRVEPGDRLRGRFEAAGTPTSENL